MCRALHDGGRRCPSDRVGATARQRRCRAKRKVQTAREALTAAQASNDAAVIAEATQNLDSAVRRMQSLLQADDAAHLDGVAQPLLHVPVDAPVETRRMGGETALTEAMTYPDGSRLVRKRNDRHGYDSGYDPVALSDAEELTPLVLRSCGLRAAAVTRTGKAEVYMEYIDGRSGYDLQVHGDDTSSIDPGSQQGNLLGLADALVAHGDRNEENVILTPAGEAVGIDNGDAYQHWPYARSPYADYLYDSDDLYERNTVPNDFTPADMAILGERLQALRPAFEQRGRGAWHDDMMRRHAQIAAQARGSANVVTTG